MSINGRSRGIDGTSRDELSPRADGQGQNAHEQGPPGRLR